MNAEHRPVLQFHEKRSSTQVNSWKVSAAFRKNVLKVVRGIYFTSKFSKNVLSKNISSASRSFDIFNLIN